MVETRNIKVVSSASPGGTTETGICASFVAMKMLFGKVLRRRFLWT